MAAITEKDKEALLKEWRDRHFSEMDANLQVWKDIRDCVSSKDKDRIEAAKNIARALAALQPDAVAPKKPEEKKAGATKKDDTFELSKEEEKRVLDTINGVYH